MPVWAWRYSGHPGTFSVEIPLLKHETPGKNKNLLNYADQVAGAAEHRNPRKNRKSTKNGFLETLYTILWAHWGCVRTRTRVRGVPKTTRSIGDELKTAEDDSTAIERDLEIRGKHENHENQQK